MLRRISMSGCARLSDRQSVHPSVRMSVMPSLRRLLGASYAEYSALFPFLWTRWQRLALELLGSSRGGEQARGPEQGSCSQLTFGSLHRGDVWVDENSFDFFFFESLDCLTAGVIELSSLTDTQTARSQDQHFLGSQRTSGLLVGRVRCKEAGLI